MSGCLTSQIKSIFAVSLRKSLVFIPVHILVVCLLCQESQSRQAKGYPANILLQTHTNTKTSLEYKLSDERKFYYFFHCFIPITWRHWEHRVGAESLFSRWANACLLNMHSHTQHLVTPEAIKKDCVEKVTAELRFKWWAVVPWAERQWE